LLRSFTEGNTTHTSNAESVPSAKLVLIGDSLTSVNYSMHLRLRQVIRTDEQHEIEYRKQARSFLKFCIAIDQSVNMDYAIDKFKRTLH
jgi:hypothetical protein